MIDFVPNVVLAAVGPVIPTAAAKASALPQLPLNIQQQLQQQIGAAQVVHQSPLALNHPWLTHTFAGVFVVSAVLLVILLAVQTTKQEGLSGTIGGRVEAAYRPRLGFDQQLARLTGVVAITFVIFATIVSLSGI